MNALTKGRKEKSGSLRCLWGLAVLEYGEGTWQRAASLTKLGRWLNAHIKERRWRDVDESLCWLKGWGGQSEARAAGRESRSSRQSGHTVFLPLRCPRRIPLSTARSFQRTRLNSTIKKVSVCWPPLHPPPPPPLYSQCFKRLWHITVDKWDIFFFSSCPSGINNTYKCYVHMHACTHMNEY